MKVKFGVKPILDYRHTGTMTRYPKQFTHLYFRST